MDKNELYKQRYEDACDSVMNDWKHAKKTQGEQAADQNLIAIFKDATEEQIRIGVALHLYLSGF